MLRDVRLGNPTIGPTDFDGRTTRTGGRSGALGAGSSKRGAAIDAGTVTRHPYGGITPDIHDIDDYAPDYANSPELGRAMEDLYDHYQKHGFEVTPGLREKLGNLAQARGIPLDTAIAEHHKFHDLAVNWKQAPPMDPAQMTPAQMEKYKDRKLPDLELPEGFWGSAQQLGSAHVLGQVYNGLSDVFAAFISPSLGITGPGTSGAFLSENSIPYKEGGGFWAGAYNTLASIGNWFADGIGDHSKYHDPAGQAYNHSKRTKGYGYPPLSFLPTSWPVTGQVTGVLYSYGRKIAKLPGQLGAKLKEFFAPAAPAPNGLMPNQPTQDFDLNFAAEPPSFIEQALDGVKSLAGDVWSGVKNVTGRAWAEVKNMASSAWRSVKSVLSKVPSDDRTNPFRSILEQRDYGMFAHRGQSLTDFRAQQAQRGQSFRNGVSSIAKSAWDGITSAASSVADTARSVGSSIADTAKSAWDGAKSAWDGITSALGFGDKPDTGRKRSNDNNSDNGNDRPSSNPSNGGSNASHSHQNSREDGGAML